MSKESNVVDFYILCNRLKKIIRTGWMKWHVLSERIESVAEHIYGVQMLALAMKSEYQYDIDIFKVIFMLAIHELGETIIGDLTQFEISKEEKKLIEHEAVHNILGGLVDGRFIEELFLEFDERKTNEAIFAYQCDKLECDIQSKIYDTEAIINLNNMVENEAVDDFFVKRLLDSGFSFSEMWMKFGQEMYHYDDNFMAVSDYVLKNDVIKRVNL